MGTLSLLFSLIVLSAAAYGDPIDCPESYGIPSDLMQVNGLWNVQALAAFQEAEPLKPINYAYGYVSISEVEANVTCSFNPIYNLKLENYRYHRVDDQKVSLSYSANSTEGDIFTVKFLQSNPESLIVIQEESNEMKIAFLFSRGLSLPEADVEQFKKWSKCGKLNYPKEFQIKVNYAQECHGLFEKSNPLEDIEDRASWTLVAKSSSLVDAHYLRRILYKGKLEISKKGDAYIVREILTLPSGAVLKEQTYTKGEADRDVIIISYKTGKDLLLLAIRTKEEMILFLASKRSKAPESVLETFERQARCFETQHIYLIPGSKTADNEACGSIFDQMTPVALKESLGKWSLTVSAYDKLDITVSDVLVEYGWIEISLTDDKPHMYYASINEGSFFKLGKDNIELDDTDGYVTFKDVTTSIKSTMYRVSPDCILFTTLIHDNPEAMIFLFCRSAQVPSAAIKKFSEYAICMKCNYIVIRKHSSLSCLDIPHEIPVLDDNKIAGRWIVFAAASSVLKSDYNISPEVRFILRDEKITILDGARNDTITVDRKEGSRLHCTTENGAVTEMRFYELSDGLLVSWNGNLAHRQISLSLLSKSDRVVSADIDKFKHFASCLTIPMVFVKE